MLCTQNPNDSSDKFDEKADEGFFFGYSTTSKAYRVYNKNSQTVEKKMNIRFDENILTHKNESEPSSII